MVADHPYARLVDTLEARDALLARWREAFEQSPLRMPRPGLVREIEPLVLRLVDGLYQAMPDRQPDGTWVSSDLRAGSPHTRAVEQSVAFVGATMAATGTQGFDVAAAVLSLRDVLLPCVDADEQGALRWLFEWLLVICQDSWGMARERIQTEKLRELVERDTPVLLLAPTVTAVTLVGAPDGVALDAIFARLTLLIVRMGATCALIDATGLENPARPEVCEALGRLFVHRKVAGKVHILAVGLTAEAESAWRAVAQRTETSIAFESQFYDALHRAYLHAGFRLVDSRA